MFDDREKRPVPALATRLGRPFAGAVFAAFLLAGPAVSAGVLDRVREEGVFRIGYRVDVEPFAYRDAADRAAGYSVELCERIAVDLGKSAGLDQLTVEYVPVGTEERFDAVAGGEIDILCGTTTASLSRREKVSFSIPTFITGIATLVDVDAAAPVKEVLSGRGGPLPREKVQEALRGKRFAVRAGTTAEEWLRANIAELAPEAEIVAVADHRDGLAEVAEGAVDAYFADRAILVGLVMGADNPDRFVVGERLFTVEPYALAIPRGDEDFRLAVDRTLSHLYRSKAFDEVLGRYFGKPRESTRLLYLAVSLPE